MTTVPTKKICVKCVRGTGIVTCDGCYQVFCQKHFSQHRKDISKEVDQINSQCLNFGQNLKEENDPTPILSAIDNWEEESIQKIRFVAQNARNDLQKMTEKNNENFYQILNKITNKINSTQETDDITEIDLTKWKDQLNALKNFLKKPFPISLINDETPTAIIRFIKPKYQSPFNKLNLNKSKTKEITIKKDLSTINNQTKIEEKFSQVAGHATITDKHLIVTFIGYSSVEGIKLYGTGIHKITLEIIQKRNQGIFFGILTSNKQITPRASELHSVYGFRDFDRIINNGNAQLQANKDKNIESGDELTLTIDCDHPKLILYHHQLKKQLQINIDINESPLPWKLLISSFGEDVVAILR